MGDSDVKSTLSKYWGGEQILGGQILGEYELLQIKGETDTKGVFQHKEQQRGGAKKSSLRCFLPFLSYPYQSYFSPLSCLFFHG